MHEVSLTRDLLKLVQQTMRQNRVERISSIQIEIGPLAGVEPVLVEQAFNALIPDTEFECTRLVVHQRALVAVCRECQKEIEIIDYQFICPNCSSPKVQVISGDQFRLMSITAESNEAANVVLGEQQNEAYFKKNRKTIIDRQS